MKKGNLLNGLTITDVKQVNKLNLIQFLKEVDSYLQQGYKLDVKSGRQVGLVLQCKMFKTEAASNIDVGSTDVGSVGEQVNDESDSVEPVEAVVKEEAPVVEEQSPLTAKKTTTRSKKTAQ